MITPKEKYKITFITNYGAFIWLIMLFGLKNVPPTYQRVVNLAFQEYLGVFMKLFLDDLNVFIDLECIWKNCNCVLTNTKNLVLVLTLKNACF
jgi:hypothetical protein